MLIRTECSFISTGTERWTLLGQMGKRSAQGWRFPLVPGYQKVGRVEDVGPAVTHIQRGQRVFMTTGRTVDVLSGWGGHMQYAVEDEAQVYDLPEQMPSEVAAGLVVVQVGWNTGHRPTIAPEALAVVIGDGIIGQFTAQALRSQGAEVRLAGRRPLRLERAANVLGDRAINVSEADSSRQVRAVCRGARMSSWKRYAAPKTRPCTCRCSVREASWSLPCTTQMPTGWNLSPVQDVQLPPNSTGGWTCD